MGDEEPRSGRSLRGLCLAHSQLPSPCVLAREGQREQALEEVDPAVISASGPRLAVSMWGQSFNLNFRELTSAHGTEKKHTADLI